MEGMGFRVLYQLHLFFLLFVQSPNRQLWKARGWGPRTEPLPALAEGLPPGQLEGPSPVYLRFSLREVESLRFEKCLQSSFAPL